MRLIEQKTYTMYLSVEEFELVLPYAESIQFGYCYYKDNIHDKEGQYILKFDEETLDELIEALKAKVSYLRYEECNRLAAKEIQDLLNDLYYEMNY